MNPKSTGAIFPNRKGAENHPDFRGFLTVTSDQIRKLVEMGKAGMEPRLQIALWKRKARDTGNPYLYAATEAYIKEEKAPPPKPQDPWGEGSSEKRQEPWDAGSSAESDPFKDDDIPF